MGWNGLNYDYDEGVRLARALVREYASEEYSAGYIQRRQRLREAFRNYRTSTSAARAYLKRLVELHAEKCRSGSTESRRRHNTFVLAYITDRKFTPKEIARMQRISVRVVWRDLNHVLDVMMIYAFGVFLCHCRRL